MNLRRVEAASYREALAKVRAVYGDDALIVGTRTFQRGGVLGLGGKQVVEVYVTEARRQGERAGAAPAAAPVAAAVAPYPYAPAFAPAAPQPAPAPPSTAFDAAPALSRLPEPPVVAPEPKPGPSGEFSSRLNEINEALEKLRGEVQRLLRRSEGPPWGHAVIEAAYALLRELDVEEAIAREIVGELDRSVLPESTLGDGMLRGLLAAHVARFIATCEGERRVADGGIHILIGPTGVGKTTSIAKLAARDRYARGRRVALVTLDTFRIAAVDQLRKYAEIIGLELRVATDPAGFRSEVGALNGYDVVYVDSAGRSPADEMRVGELEAFVRAVPEATVSLVLSMTAGVRSLKTAIEKFRRVGFSSLILTKLDETQGPGAILTAIAEARAPALFVTNGQNVPDDLEVMDPQRLADAILGSGRG